MFRQQTDHCTTNSKTNGTKTFTTFLHKLVFLRAVAETVLRSVILLNTEIQIKNKKKELNEKNQIYFHSKLSVLFRSNEARFCSQY